jgi:hypothetical protein
MKVTSMVTLYSSIFPVLHARLVLDYVKAGDAAQGSVGPRQSLANGGVKALGRGGCDFCHARYGHSFRYCRGICTVLSVA